MNTTSPRQAALLGLFVSFGVAILVATLFALGGLRELFSSKVEVTAAFDEVNGLRPGDAVWFSGVPVGTVKEVRFAKAGIEVELNLEYDASEWIPADSLARVSSDSLIGNKIIVLADGTEGGPPIKDGTLLRSGTTVTPEQIMAQFQESNDNLLVITNNLREVSGRLVDEESSISQFLSDDQLYADVTRTVDGLQTASKNASVLTSDIAKFTSELNQAGNLPHDLVTDRTIHASLVASAASVEKATANASVVMSSLEQDVKDPGTPMGVLLHDREAGSDLAGTLAELETSTALLSENLEAMQHNFLLRGFFKKKAKEEKKAAEAGGADAVTQE